MTRKLRVIKFTLRNCRILLVWGMCVVLASGSSAWLAAQQQTPQQQQQERERQQQQEQQREEQQREQQQQQEQERQREEQQRQQEQEQQREEQQRQQQQEQEHQREEQQRQQQQEQQEQQREQQQREQQQQQQREQQQEQERQREEQQREEQQRVQQQRQEQQQREVEQQEQQRETQQRMKPQTRIATPARPEPPDPQLHARPINPEPIRPAAPRLPDPHPVDVRPGIGPEIRPNPTHRPVTELPGLHPAPAHPEVPHPARPLPAIVPRHGLEPLHFDPPHRDDHPPVIVERPRPVVVVRPTTEVILGLAPPPRRAVLVPAPAPAAPSAPSYAAAQAQLQAAQSSCAQADAYQNYVNSVINNQNNLSQGVDQILQTIADNTSDPDTQNAILGAIGQPNPINDALQQQLQAQVSTYESLCQNRLAAAQAAIPPDPSQQAAPGTAAQPGDGTSAPLDPSAVTSSQQLATPPQDTAQPPQAEAAPSAPASGQACTSGVTMPLPQVRSPWGSWVPLGDTGLVFGVSRVNATTLTWRFFNAGAQTVASMNFTYTFTDADTGQATTQSDLLPYALAPGQSVGGWAAYTANTRGNVSLQITQIACQ